MRKEAVLRVIQLDILTCFADCHSADKAGVYLLEGVISRVKVDICGYGINGILCCFKVDVYVLGSVAVRDIAAENERTRLEIPVPAYKYRAAVGRIGMGVKINIDSLLVVPVNKEAKPFHIFGYLVSKSRTDISALCRFVVYPYRRLIEVISGHIYIYLFASENSLICSEPVNHQGRKHIEHALRLIVFFIFPSALGS